MTVRSRLLWSLTALVACSGLVGAAALLGLVSFGSHFTQAEDHHHELRSLYEIGHRAAVMRILLADEAPDSLAIERQLAIALLEAEKLPSTANPPTSPNSHRDQSARAAIQPRLERIALGLSNDAAAVELRAEVNRTLNEVASLAGAAESAILANRALAVDRSRIVLGIMAAIFLITIAVALIVGVRLYRAVMNPLRAIDRALNRLGEADLGCQLAEHGDREFRRLMRHFNITSAALARLHASMQDQVEIKSRQLIRSEQLAGVGSLAAGLAHEINNPLGIIAGFAQNTLRKLRADRSNTPHIPATETERRIENTLETICDEAFRCRDITRDLLLLAQPARPEPRAVQLVPLVQRAVALVAGLELAQGRQITLLTDESDAPVTCIGHASELLQVFINLFTNALEACPPTQGFVHVSIEPAYPDRLITRVIDNGCGMDHETLQHAFDPFFTAKPRRGLIGCGLGLSVSHAIIERHGGRLYAHSDGPGCGSTFVVELPVAAIGEEIEPCLTQHA